MTELFTALENAMVLSFYEDYDGDFHVTQFMESAELDTFLATADEISSDELGYCYRFGSTLVVVADEIGEDE